MVDVGDKRETDRRAVARGRVLLRPATLAALRSGSLPKGDALAVARVAGIMGAKRTPDLIPLCHPIRLSGVRVDVRVGADAVLIECEVRTTDRTGVEMEALTAVSMAALSVIDMVKAMDPGATVAGVQVVSKHGGVTGEWLRPADPDALPPDADLNADQLRVLVVTVSTRAAAGVYADRSGPVLVAAVAELGAVVDGPQVVSDGGAVESALRAGVAAGYDVIITTGGTGFTPDDRTPEMTRRVLDLEIPGIAEALRAAGVAAGVPTAVFSRGLAGLAGSTVVVNLPGSIGGVRDGLAVLLPLLTEIVRHARGGSH